MPLNIDWQQILLHLLNFVVLFGILYFLLYKPVKEFMDSRTEYYKSLDDEAKKNLESSEKAKAEYQNKLDDIEGEIIAKKEKARKELEKASATHKKQAEAEASKIIADARKSAERERVKMLKEVQNEISDMVTDATEKLVVNASTSDAFDQFLEAAQRSEADEQL